MQRWRLLALGQLPYMSENKAPAAQLFSAGAVRLSPPLTEEKSPLAVLFCPPLTEESPPLAMLPNPPLTEAPTPLAVF